MLLKYFLCFIFSATVAINAFAVHLIPDYTMDRYNETIQRIYQDYLLKMENVPISKRVDIISGYFLGKTYLNGALGEGKSALFDQEPLYRTDAFDCATYVSTVLSLVESNNLGEFRRNMRKIQYKNAIPTFVNRLHFTSVDWNVTNAQNDFIQDITGTFKDAHGKYIAKTAHAIINKPNWYKKMTANNLSIIHPLSAKEEKKRLYALKNLSKKVSIEESNLLYLPLKKLFDNKGNSNDFLFAQIPDGSIIEIVRPNWNLEKIIGTHLNVSHMGFAIYTSQGLVFREASSLKHQVIDTPLIDYLKNYRDSPTVKGINIQKII